MWFTEGAAGFRAVVFFSYTYFGEIIIFELSKDPTFRNPSTLENPQQFLILVTHLIIVNILPKLTKNIKIFTLWAVFLKK